MWTNAQEIQFFTEALKNFASPEQLFYKIKSGYFSYIPKGLDADGQTLQSRNSLIGQFTEKWCKNLLEPVANKLGLYAVNDVVCEEIGLNSRSSADLAFCKVDGKNQNSKNIKIIFEIKMSIVSNYQLTKPNKIDFIGDYKSHKGSPSLLRSDSMLKAIGKSINIRVSGVDSAKIPIIILGNSPISDNYQSKVDFLKTAGVIQGFLNLNSNPTNSNFTKSTPNLGFQTIYNIDELYKICDLFLDKEMNYFFLMISKYDLGEIIKISNHEVDEIKKAEKFLELIRGVR